MIAHLTVTLHNLFSISFKNFALCLTALLICFASLRCLTFQSFRFVQNSLPNFPSFWDCKGNNLFSFPQAFFYFLNLLFFIAFRFFVASFAGCKGRNLFSFSQEVFLFFSCYFQCTISAAELPRLRVAKVQILFVFVK
jgi:hypothetical protein